MDKQTASTTLKAKIKGLTEEKVSLTRARTKHKNQPSEKKQVPEYQSWFVPVDHRRVFVRYEIRHHLLAYAYVRGRAYRRVENRCLSAPQATKIVKILHDHGYYEYQMAEKIPAWLEADKAQDKAA